MRSAAVIVRALSSASMAKPPEKDEKIARIQGDGDNADADVDGADVPLGWMLFSVWGWPEVCGDGEVRRFADGGVVNLTCMMDDEVMTWT